MFDVRFPVSRLMFDDFRKITKLNYKWLLFVKDGRKSDAMQSIHLNRDEKISIPVDV